MARVKCWCQRGAFSRFLILVIREKSKEEAVDCCCCLTSGSLNASSVLAHGGKRAFSQADAKLRNATCLKLPIHGTEFSLQTCNEMHTSGGLLLSVFCSVMR